MPVPTTVADLSTTIASNSPAGSDNVFPSLDDYLRALSGILASVANNSATNGYTSPYLALTGGTVTGATTFSSTVTGAKFIPTGTSATGNGMYLPATNTLGFSTNGAEVMRLDSSGNLGLGVTPSAQTGGNLQLGSTAYVTFNAAGGYISGNSIYNAGWKYQSNGYATQYLADSNAGAHKWYIAPSGTAGAAISFTQAMTLDASGNLGVGSTAPIGYSGYSGITVQNTNGGFIHLRNSANTNQMEIAVEAGNTGYVKTVASIPLIFGTNNAERARITSGGDLLVGKTAIGTGNVGVETRSDGQIYASLTSSTNATSTLNVYSTDAAAYRFYVGLGGTIYATSTTITAISDQRLKENIRDLDAGLSEVMALKPRKFDWKAGKGKDKKNDRGWIAQEFEQVFPDMVDTWQDPAPEGEEPYKAVNADLIPILVKAIQEQQALITDLRARVAALEAA